MTNLDPHYTNSRLAALYDLDSPWGEDTDFYLAIAGAKPLWVTDVGCGTGTLACGLAAAGHQVTGVDPAKAMLDVAWGKPQATEIHWLKAAAADFALAQKQDLLTMTGHAFQVLLSDAEIAAALGNFASQLRRGGLLVFESRNPDLNWDEMWRTEQTWQTEMGVVRQVRSDFSREGEYVDFRHTFYFPDATLVSDSRLRFASEARIRALLSGAGFEIKATYGDWRGGELRADSEEMIFVAERR
ncbi:MAG: class I SAM-dependent methyltransferase [Pseudomonadales bacterium]